MDEDEKLKLMYEKAIEMHRLFLGWRDKLFAGHLVILGTLLYNLDKHKCNDTYFIAICIAGIIITIIFVALSVRNTVIYWQCQTTAYFCEQELTKTNKFIGLYSLFYYRQDKEIYKKFVEIQGNATVDNKYDNDNMKKYWNKSYNVNFLNIFKSNAYSINLKNHTGAINLVYLISLLGFLAFLITSLIGMS